MLTRWRKKSNTATDERDALYKEYRKTTKKFEDVRDKVSPTLDELLWRCERANHKYDLFESSLEAFRAALKKLQANEAACDKAAAAEEVLSKARKARGNHPDSRQADEAMEKAKRDAQEAKEKTAQDLEIAIKEVEKARETGLKHMEEDFGTRQVRSSSHKEVDNLKKYFEYTRYMLERKSIDNLAQAITYWQRASQVQKKICTAYDKDEISRLQDETGELQEEVYNLIRNLSAADIHTVERKTQRIRKIKEESKSLKQEVNLNKTVGHDNYVLSEIFLELKLFHGEVEFAEQKRVREKRKEEKHAQAKLGAEDVQKGAPHS